jgi:SAM-dependent methyltransferase
MDSQKLDAFLQKVVGDLGAAFSIAPVRIGGALGLYAAMAETGAVDAAGLAQATGYAERYLAEWLCHQAASGYVECDPVSGRFTLPAEHAFLLADPESPAQILRGFCTAAALSDNFAAVMQVFQTGGGVHWGDQSGCLACFIAEFFRPGYRANLLESSLPALEGVTARLEAGARVADIGCGHGHSTRIMAEAFPNSTFIGIDIHAPSIEAARAHIAEQGLSNVSFEVGSAQDLDGAEFDFVACFDALHDMGDPAGAARAIRASLKAGGTWMIVEPNAADQLEDNLTPISRMSYAASTITCVPGALAQAGGVALGAQAGEARLRDVVVGHGGFLTLRRAADTPLNLVLEARAA